MRILEALIGEQNLDRIQRNIAEKVNAWADQVIALIEPPVKKVFGDFTITAETVVEYRGSGGHVITLPKAGAIPGASRQRRVLNNGSAAINLTAQGGETVNAGVSIALEAGACAQLDANGDTVWRASGTVFTSAAGLVRAKLEGVDLLKIVTAPASGTTGMTLVVNVGAGVVFLPVTLAASVGGQRALQVAG